MEVVSINLKKCDLFEDLAQNILEWKNGIHVADPSIVGTWDKALMMSQGELQ